MDFFELFKIILFAVAFIVTTAIPYTVKLVSASKAKKAATSAAEKEKAHNDMIEAANGFILAAETAFKGFDSIMRQQNTTAGEMKKDNVITKLQAYALSHGYVFDAEYWSQKVDEIVAFTKKVNAK